MCKYDIENVLWGIYNLLIMECHEKMKYLKHFLYCTRPLLFFIQIVHCYFIQCDISSTSELVRRDLEEYIYYSLVDHRNITKRSVMKG